ncbi:class I SAM-dependent methyltransferase [Kribbella sp. NPDC026611]|uniref:class I SAM-dependent methyltransferase n=1 Tax=Kribbella sp. NPDC026611 TaxID=3154911 RepID=UPI0033C0F910
MPFDRDAEMRFYHQRYLDACAVRPGDRVLDVGCGAGQTTRDVGRIAASVLGVDISEHPSWQTDEPGVSFLRADAAVYPFGSFDVCISRFGTMFFDDPAAAFANLRRTGARLAMLVWQPRSRNEWAMVIPEAFGGSYRDDSPFSLGHQDRTRRLLMGAGFGEPTFTPLEAPVYYGADAGAAYDAVLQLREPTRLLAELDPPAADAARERLRALFAAHETGDGVLFDGAAWIVTAE